MNPSRSFRAACSLVLLAPACKRWPAFAVALLGSLAMTANAWAVGPFFEDFESEPTCGATCASTCVLSASGFVNVDETRAPINQANNRDWLVDTGGTASSPTGPPADHTSGTATGKYLYLETSSPCSTQTYETNLLSPVLDIDTLTVPTVEFWYHLFGEDIGELHVDVLDATGAVLQLDVIPAVVGDQGDAWIKTPAIDLTPFQAGNTQVMVRIRGLHLGASFLGDQAIDDFEFFDDTGIDAGVTNVATAASGCNLGMAETVAVAVTNNGLAAISMVPISLSLDGGPSVMEMVPGPINPGQTINYTFAATVDLSANGVRNVAVSIALPNDGKTGNDDTDVDVISAPTRVVAGNALIDDLESPTTPFFWRSGGAENEWEWGAPTDALVGGTTSGVNAWATDLNSTYERDANNFLETLFCYDFAGVTNATLQVQINYDLEDDFDGVALQASTDAGVTWTNVGDTTTGTNWYNSNGISAAPGGSGTGWTGDDAAGTNGAYVGATIDVSSFAGQSDVRFRFVMASDGSFQDEGFAFDDFNIFDVSAPLLTVAGDAAAAGTPIAASAAGATDMLMQSLFLVGSGGPNFGVDAITITKLGTLADAEIAGVKLWLDDGDGSFDAAVDTQVGATGTFMNGTSAIGTTGSLALTEFTPSRVFVTYDLATTAPAAATFGSSIAMATDVVETNAAAVTLNPMPAEGILLDVAGALPPPIIDDFSGGVAARTVQGTGSFPTATAVGTAVGTTTFPQEARFRVGPTPTALQPIDGPNVFAMDWPDGAAGGALDYIVDLSALNPMTDNVVARYRWAQFAEEDINDAEYVFVSTDGGATWEAALAALEPSVVPDGQWLDLELDLSALFTRFNLTFTSNVVLRFQGDDDAGLNGDGYLIDRVFIGTPATPVVERIAGTPIPTATTDALGQVPATAQSLMYMVNNDGDLPLTIDDESFVAGALTNVSGVTFTLPMAPIEVPAGGTVGFQVDYTVDSEAAFSFDITFDLTGDGDAMATTYTFTVSGDGVANEPEIDIQRPAGMSIASGQTDAQGSMIEIGMAESLTYTIENLGFVDLNVSGVAIVNDNNVAAQITTPPAAVVPAGMTTTFDVSFSATAEGAFGFDVEVGSDDTDEGTYVITVSGTAFDPDGGSGGAGGGTPAATTNVTATTTTTGAGGSDGSGGGDGNDNDSDDDGGCGCRVPNGRGGTHPAGAATLLVLGVAMVRRRRRRSA